MKLEPEAVFTRSRQGKGRSEISRGGECLKEGDAEQEACQGCGLRSWGDKQASGGRIFAESLSLIHRPRNVQDPEVQGVTQFKVYLGSTGAIGQQRQPELVIASVPRRQPSSHDSRDHTARPSVKSLSLEEEDSGQTYL